MSVPSMGPVPQTAPGIVYLGAELIDDHASRFQSYQMREARRLDSAPLLTLDTSDLQESPPDGIV